MTDKAKALVRTAWPMLLGHVAAYLVAVTEPAGIQLDTALAYEVTGWVLGTAVYLAGVNLERVKGEGLVARTARVAGRVLLSLGLNTGRPVYPPK